MIRKDIVWSEVPDGPGVYFFMGAKREILYIGKATSLKQRLGSYFAKDLEEKRSPLIEAMVLRALRVEWMQTDSVLEAMLIETNLIRTHKPEYNSRSKDNKSFQHVIITNEKYPRVLIVRGKDLPSYEYRSVFGPFPSGLLFKEAMKIIRRLFRFYDSVSPENAHSSKLRKGKVDFNRQIGLYPEDMSPREYARTIRHITLFFEGKKDRIIADLENDMYRFARHLEFESANRCKKQIFALKHIQDVSLLTHEVREYRDEKMVRIEAYDIAHLHGSDMVGVMTVCERGEPIQSEYRTFNITTCTGPNDPKALREVLTRRLAHQEWKFPDIIVVDGGVAQSRAFHTVLTEHSLVIPVVAVVKDDHHKPKGFLGSKKIIDTHRDTILLANAESHRFAVAFHRKKRRLKP